MPARFVPALGDRRRLLNDYMCIRTTKPERCDRCASRRPRWGPGRQGSTDGEDIVSELELRVWRRKARCRGQLMVLQGKDRLDQARDACRRVGVANIALRRAQQAVAEAFLI